MVARVGHGVALMMRRWKMKANDVSTHPRMGELGSS